MAHDSSFSMFIFPSLSLADRKIVLDLGELLAATDGRYREHLAMEVRILQDVAVAEGSLSTRADRLRGRVLPFARQRKRGTK